MSTDERFDESISGWLEQTAPARLPDRVLEATFERTRTSRQQIGWRAIVGRSSTPRSVPALGSAVIVVVAAALALNFLVDQQGIGSPAADPRTPFLGTWVSKSDADGGTKTMIVERAASLAVEIVVTDTIATECDLTPSTMTGTGTIDGNNLVIPTPDHRCDDGSGLQLASGEDTPRNEVPRNLTYVLDSQRSILTVDDSEVWYRPTTAIPTTEPTGEPTPSPSPTPSSSPRPSPRPGFAAFTSTIHGILIDYPTGWQIRPATEPWTGEQLDFDSPAADVIFHPTFGDRLYLILASQPYVGLSEDEWWRDQDSSLCPDGGPFGTGRFDGAVAHLRECSPSSGPRRGHGGALVVTDARGYLIWRVVSSDEPELVEAYQWSWMRPMVETVDLRPEDALDASASPTPTPSSRPSPAEGFSRFTSTTHGISIDYPTGWQIRPATEPWNHDAVTFGSPGVDVISDPSAPNGLYFALVSESLDGQPGDDWCCGEAITATEVCKGGSGFGRYTLDGARGWIMDCGFDAPTSQVLSVATSTRGYVIVLRVPDEPRYAIYGYEGDWFERMIQTVEFHPEDALDPQSVP